MKWLSSWLVILAVGASSCSMDREACISGAWIITDLVYNGQAVQIEGDWNSNFVVLHDDHRLSPPIIWSEGVPDQPNQIRAGAWIVRGDSVLLQSDNRYLNGAFFAKISCVDGLAYIVLTNSDEVIHLRDWFGSDCGC